MSRRPTCHDAARVQQASRRSSLGGTGHSVRTLPVPSRAGQMRCMPPAAATRCSAAARCSIWSSARLRQCERVSRAQLLLQAACNRQQVPWHVTLLSPAATELSDLFPVGAAAGVAVGTGAKRCVTRRSVSMSSFCLTAPSSGAPGAVARLGLRLTSVSTGCGGEGRHSLGSGAGWGGAGRRAGTQRARRREARGYGCASRNGGGEAGGRRRRQRRHACAPPSLPLSPARGAPVHPRPRGCNPTC